MLPALLVCVLVTGCIRSVATDVIPIRPAPYPLPPRPPEEVVVFLAARPEVPLIEVAMLEVQEEKGSYSSAELLDELRALAGRHGCDGIILIGDNDSMSSSTSTTVDTSTTTDPSTSETTTSNAVTTSTGTSTRHGFRASCFVYDRAAITAVQNPQ